VDDTRPGRRRNSARFCMYKAKVPAIGCKVYRSLIRPKKPTPPFWFQMKVPHDFYLKWGLHFFYRVLLDDRHKPHPFVLFTWTGFPIWIMDRPFIVQRIFLNHLSLITLASILFGSCQNHWLHLLICHTGLNFTTLTNGHIWTIVSTPDLYLSLCNIRFRNYSRTHCSIWPGG